MNIRKATLADHAKIDEIMLASSLSNPQDTEWVLANRDSVRVPESQVRDGQAYVAEVEGRVVGFAVLIPLGDVGWELDGLFVDPAWMRRGIGRALVAHVRDVAGDGQVSVVANGESAGFYRKCGFAKVGETPTMNGPALRMIWRQA